MVIKVKRESLKNPIAESRITAVVKKVKERDSFLDLFITPFYVFYQEDGDKRATDIKCFKPCVAPGDAPDFREETVFNVLCQLSEMWKSELIKWHIDFRVGPKTDYPESQEALIDWMYFGHG